MPTTKVEAKDVIDRLTEVFRTVGYDGATLSKLSAATGLQRASLYHRFPGGKKEMAKAVLSRAGVFFQKHILAPLTGPGTPKERLQRMATKLDAFYCRGNSSCLLDTLSFGDGRDMFESHIQESFSCWIEAIARFGELAEGRSVVAYGPKYLGQSIDNVFGFDFCCWHLSDPRWRVYRTFGIGQLQIGIFLTLRPTLAHETAVFPRKC